MTEKRLSELEYSLLYDEYKALCIDRDIYAKSQTELSHADDRVWLNYVISLVRGYPSLVGRQATLQNPFREPGDT